MSTANLHSSQFSVRHKKWVVDHRLNALGLHKLFFRLAIVSKTKSYSSVANSFHFIETIAEQFLIG